ncbi:MAG: hypothetical protein U5L00_03140 [Desulfovermiculus sp.]|nr:hypothetical protein [Desulfovermiculus sp.]
MEPALVKYIQELTPGSPPPAIAHQKLLQLQREFFCVGGMSEAVFEYQKKKSLISVQEVHRSIIDTYQDDFAKYARRNDLMLLQKVLSFIPRALGQKIKYAAAEVDYVLSLSGKVVPVEVKSGKSGALKSPYQFMHRRGLARAVRFDLNLPSEQNVTHAISTKKGVAEVNFTLISLPLYAVEELPWIMKTLGGESSSFGSSV